MRITWLALTGWLITGGVAAAKTAAPCKPQSTVEVAAKGVRAVLVPDARTFVTGNVDGSIRFYDLKSGKPGKVIKAHTGEIYALALSPDGKTLASGSDDKKIHLWDLKAGTRRSTLAGHENTIRSLAFAEDGKTLLSASLDRQLGRWNVESGKLEGMLGGQACILMGVATGSGKFKDGSPLAGTACNDGRVRLWNLRNGKPQTVLEGHDGEVHAVAFSPSGGDNPPMASGDNEDKVILWDVRAGTAVQTWEGVGWTDAVTFSPDGKLLVSSGNDMAQKGLFKVFDVEGKKLINEQFPHDGNIPSVAFTRDGKTLLTAGMDETVKLWDVGELRKGCSK